MKLWKHKKRGSTYSEQSRQVRVQCETPLQDNEIVMLYRNTSDGTLSVRRESEFMDGRFEPVEPVNLATAPEKDAIDIFRAQPGDKVRLAHPENGFEPDKMRAKGIDPTQIFTIKYISMGGWSTILYLEEIDGGWNSVQFVDAEPRPPGKDLSKQEYTAEIRNAWMMGKCVAGEAWNDKKRRFRDGDRMYSSAVSRWEGDLAHTANSVYKIISWDPGYLNLKLNKPPNQKGS